ncbi:MAG: glycosyltransferase [Galactobacillus timonensis]|uniref:glycosyltransferase n=1 Tax=Galactobacillus timonensis TaxID=2041840 RepID=UPI00240A9B3E|nr:glycosyltransferase [Galactobacillus timonensis]MDD6369791.1 glycosyltransferase [Galactobacillus timonensis]MDD6600330.1 glycosyltransferase [Galactobacillus timonensis]
MENEKRTILFVNDEMRMGGVARVLNTLMAALPKDRYEIDLLILHKRGMLLEEVPQGVHVLEGTPFFTPVDESLDMIWASRDWKELFKKLRLLFYMKTRLIIPKIRRERKKILTKQYDVEVAAKEGFCTIFTASGDSRRKINWVLTDYSVCNYSRNHMPLVKQALRSIDLNIADSTQAMIAYNTVFKVRNSVTIHNLMDTASIERKLAEDPDGKAIQDSSSPNLISVVRFHPQKAVDRLLYASHEATKAGYAHTLYLVGGGEEEGKLRKIVSDLKMDNVVFLGYMANPYGAMRKADLFVLPSLYEGFATVISESLIVGTPVLSTDVSGAREQITKPDEGWVVENSQEGLNNGLIEALSNLDRLKEMKKALAGYTYPNDEVLQQFMDVL